MKGDAWPQRPPRSLGRTRAGSGNRPSVMVAFSTCRQGDTSSAHTCSRSPDILLLLLGGATFTVDTLLLGCSHRPPPVTHRPSAHSPSEQAAVKAVLLLQPLSTDSACQLLQEAAGQGQRMSPTCHLPHHTPTDCRYTVQFHVLPEPHLSLQQASSHC